MTSGIVAICLISYFSKPLIEPLLQFRQHHLPRIAAGY
jgi:hypothetical protein